jgi:hypothetical protein
MSEQIPNTAHIITNTVDGIIYMKITDAGRQTIDAFVEVMHNIHLTYPPDAALYVIYDFSETIAAFLSPYGQAKLNEMVKWRPEREFYSAVIFKQGLVMSVLQGFMKNFYRSEKYHYTICFSEEEARSWLADQMPGAVVG